MNRHWLTAALAVGLAVAAITGALAIQTGQQAPVFRLSDQFNKTWDLSGLRGNVVVVLAATQESGRAMGPWMDNLKNAYSGRVQILGLMDLHGIPGFARGIARSRIKKETNDPLMIDFSGATARTYEASDNYPVVTVIDKNGVVRVVQRSGYSSQAFGAVRSAIDSALRAGR